MLEIGLVTGSEYEGKHLKIQVDGYGGKDTGVPYGEGHWIGGVCHRPMDPELDADGSPIPHKACQALFQWEGGRLHVIPTIDPRIVAKMPTLKKGGSILPSAQGAFFLVDGDGVTTLYVPDGAGSAHVVSLTPGGPVQILHQGGAGITLQGTSALITSGNGQTFIELRNDGGTLAGNWNLRGSIGPLVPLAVGAPAIQGTP